MTAAIVFAVLSALSNACSAVLQRLAVVSRCRTKARPPWRAAIDLVRQPMWLLGALFLIGTFGFQALALYFGPLSVVQPILVLELIFTLGLRVLLLHDNIASRTWALPSPFASGWPPSWSWRRPRRACMTRTPEGG